MDRRNTVQKKIVLDAVRELAKHATADEVYEHVHKKHEAIGKGTIYRNLNVLAEEGEIRRVEVSDGPDRFDHTCREHYHMECLKCGDILDVDMDAVSDMMARIKDCKGMKIMTFDILFKGICAACQK